jgi:L-glyceraldehyde 3-phosphate reductase
VQVATEAGFTPASLAYAYCLRHPKVASILFGATSVAQISENLAALDAVERIDDDLVAQLHALFPADGGFLG